MASKELKHNSVNKLNNSNVKYRKVKEGPLKKTGIEQLEQMKIHKRTSRDATNSINNVGKSINKNEMNGNIKKESKKKNVSIQELSDNINKNITVFKSKSSIEDNTVTKGILSEKKNNSINKKSDRVVEKGIDKRIDQKIDKRVDRKKSNNFNKNNNLEWNVIDDMTVEKQSIPIKKREKITEVTDISETSKVRKQIKRRSDRKKRQEKARVIKERINQINFKKVIIVGSISLILIGLGIALYMTRIKTTIIEEGNNYSKTQVEDMVIDGLLEHNSVYLFLKYRYSDQEKIPFVEYIDVSWEGPTSVKIKVYDKSIIACTKFMNKYIYFDKDGMVVETSSKRQQNIQYISGLNFSEVKLNDKIKVKDDDIFDTILSVTQQINKYNLKIKEINFDDKNNLTLYTEDVTVLLGKQKTYDEQLAKLKSMLKEASKKNLKGIMHMENYTEDQKRIIFNKID